MTSLESRVIEALKRAAIYQHSSWYGRAENVVNRMKLTDEERIKAHEIAREWVR